MLYWTQERRKNVNERVRELRKALGLTMEKFGEKLGVKKNTVSQWESGINALSDQMIKAICNVNWDSNYVNEEWLRTGIGEMFMPDAEGEIEQLTQKYNLSHGMQIFIEKLIKTKPEVQEALIDFITEMSDEIREMGVNSVVSDFPQIAMEQSVDYVNDVDISKNEDDYIPLTQSRLAAIRRSLPKTPEELERQFPPVEFKRKKSDAG